MSIVGHAEPLDYDIYARDDYYFGYSNPEFKALIAALDDSVDAAARKDLLQQIQRKLAADAVNGFLFQYPRLDIWNAHVHGIGFDNVLGVVDVTRAYFDDAARVQPRRRTGRHTGACACLHSNCRRPFFGGRPDLIDLQRAPLRQRVSCRAPGRAAGHAARRHRDRVRHRSGGARRSGALHDGAAGGPGHGGGACAISLDSMRRPCSATALGSADCCMRISA